MLAQFQPTVEPRCRQIVTTNYSDPHPCPWPAKEDGFCARHSPTKLLATVRKRVAWLESELVKANKRVTELEGLHSKGS